MDVKDIEFFSIVKKYFEENNSREVHLDELKQLDLNSFRGLKRLHELMIYKLRYEHQISDVDVEQLMSELLNKIINIKDVTKFKDNLLKDLKEKEPMIYRKIKGMIEKC